LRRESLKPQGGVPRYAAMRVKLIIAPLLIALVLVPASAGLSLAQQAANLTVTVKNHRFQPAELHAPANVPINIRVKNLDSSRMEFESDGLHVEKVIGGNSEAVIQIKPQAPGKYDFYDDFNQQATGSLVVR
jgi:cupredoxin-like protein